VSSQKLQATANHAEKRIKQCLTFISQGKSTHLWKIFERLYADHSSENFEPDDGDLVLFDKSWPCLTLLVRLFVDEADQGLKDKRNN